MCHLIVSINLKYSANVFIENSLSVLIAYHSFFINSLTNHAHFFLLPLFASIPITLSVILKATVHPEILSYTYMTFFLQWNSKG